MDYTRAFKPSVIFDPGSGLVTDRSLRFPLARGLSSVEYVHQPGNAGDVAERS